MTEEARFTIDELCARTGTTRRTVRYYVAEGLLSPPAGRGRGGFYGAAHAKRLEAIRALRAKGLALEAIRRLLAGEGAPPEDPSAGTVPAPPPRDLVARYPLAAGVTLEVSRGAEERLGADLARLLSLISESLDRAAKA